MTKTEINSPLKTLKNRYRLVITNDDTFEEVITFKLSRLSVYITMSTIFVLLVGLTVALLVLTPLKYYIPGYGRKDSKSEMQALKMRTDSLENALMNKQVFLDDLKKVLSGETPVQKDTTSITVPKREISHD